MIEQDTIDKALGLRSRISMLLVVFLGAACSAATPAPTRVCGAAPGDDPDCRVETQLEDFASATTPYGKSVPMAKLVAYCSEEAIPGACKWVKAHEQEIAERAEWEQTMREGRYRGPGDEPADSVGSVSSVSEAVATITALQAERGLHLMTDRTFTFGQSNAASELYLISEKKTAIFLVGDGATTFKASVGVTSHTGIIAEGFSLGSAVFVQVIRLTSEHYTDDDGNQLRMHLYVTDGGGARGPLRILTFQER